MPSLPSSNTNPLPSVPVINQPNSQQGSQSGSQSGNQSQSGSQPNQSGGQQSQDGGDQSGQQDSQSTPTMPGLPSGGGSTSDRSTWPGDRSNRGGQSDNRTGDDTDLLPADDDPLRTRDTTGAETSSGFPGAEGEETSIPDGQQDANSAGDEGSKQAGVEGEDAPGQQHGTDQVESAGEGLHGDGESEAEPGSAEQLSVLAEQGDQQSGGQWEVSNELPGANETAAGTPGSDEETMDQDFPHGSPIEGEDEILDAALSVLDGEIQEEREEQANSGTAAEGVLGTGEDGIAVVQAGNASVGTGEETVVVGGTSSAEIPRSGGSTRVGETVASQLPDRAKTKEDEVPDARDDDVVARQLREAALAETDPELREALWEELRAYKGSIR